MCQQPDWVRRNGQGQDRTNRSELRTEYEMRREWRQETKVGPQRTLENTNTGDIAVPTFEHGRAARRGADGKAHAVAGGAEHATRSLRQGGVHQPARRVEAAETWMKHTATKEERKHLNGALETKTQSSLVAHSRNTGMPGKTSSI